MRAAFAFFDANGDGHITQEEFCKAMTHQGGKTPVSPEKAEEMFKALDTNGNSLLNYDEFTTAWTQKKLRPAGWVNPEPETA